MNKEYNITLNKAWSLSKEWKMAAIIWRTLDHVFVLGSFMASMLATYVAAERENDNNIIIVLSAIAAFLTLMGFACNPSKYMTNYRKAFDVLNDALISNTDVEGKLTSADGHRGIVEAIKRAEKYISKTYDVDEFCEAEQDSLHIKERKK